MHCSLRGAAAGLVVDDRQAAVVQLVEAVDDAAHRDSVDLGAQVQLEADRTDTVGVLQLQVAVHEHTSVGEEGSCLSLVELEALELVSVLQLPPGGIQGVLCRSPAPRARGDSR